MSLISRLGYVAILGAGSGGSVYLTLHDKLSEPHENQWVNFSHPVLSCKSSRNTYDLFIGFRDKEDSTEKELYLKGVYHYSEKEIDLEESIVTGDNKSEKVWRLTIFPSGTARLGSLDGRKDGSYGDDGDFTCTGNVFKVVNWNMLPNTENKFWEKEASSIKFKLEDCVEKGGRKECSIKVSDSVGLKWTDTFNPKAIFRIPSTDSKPK
ncbi:hypothetical protein OVS_02700 [Mycoplasma ovis str. Michigan]|uniref:Uncharacterized protein n=1 Tax=Mycoplasma ovis str. Michigan TaxID=1415773 RepID=A0ABN4BLT4_9MOLU|nr:hypothetical protein [Mycoplasma ovis]AHC40348.1 hypothetical protein OVS_02700 [Mycoplasma ovis str. Michigan]